MKKIITQSKYSIGYESYPFMTRDVDQNKSNQKSARQRKAVRRSARLPIYGISLDPKSNLAE
jgi:hypothetical protein